MLQSLFDSIYSLLTSENFVGLMNNFGGHSYAFALIVATGCVLILLTVSFVFKFLLKLVER